MAIKTKYFIFNLVFIAITFNGFAQNLVSPNWSYSFKKDSTTYESRNINLLLSWERQGLSYLSQKGELTNTFYIPKNITSTDYILEITLLAEVHDIYINKIVLGETLKQILFGAKHPIINLEK